MIALVFVLTLIAAQLSTAESSLKSHATMRQEARVKALEAAMALLHSQVNGRPKEADEVAKILSQTSTLRSNEMPRGTRAWCPSLSLNITGWPLEPNPLSLVSCINRNYTLKQMTWDAAMKDDLASIGKSKRPPHYPSTDSSLPLSPSCCRGLVVGKARSDSASDCSDPGYSGPPPPALLPMQVLARTP
jgi:hypothetical protein